MQVVVSALILLVLVLEQDGNRRLRTIRPDFVQARTLSLSSVLQREGNTAFDIWESKYLNHKLLLDFYSLYLQ